MIPHSSKHSIKSKGIDAGKEFSIKMSSKAFQTLSSTLYSNKPLAVIRELTCNAWDSHVEANNTDTPVEISLPTYLEPTFKITDFGTGLSDDDIMTMYTTFFHSTKEESNEVIGSFGLGSKSPFAVTDSFTVKSRFNGKETSYLIYLNEDKIPAITRLSSVDYDGHSGLTVEVPVASSIADSFERSASEFFEYWTGNVKFIGKQINIIYRNKILELNGVVFYENNYYYSKIYARIGGVVYEIDHDKISVTLKFRSNVIIDFEIGELDIAPSRESLSYNEETIDAIRKKSKRSNVKHTSILKWNQNLRKLAMNCSRSLRPKEWFS